MGIRGKDLKPRKPRCDKKSPLDMVECKDCHHTYHRHALSQAGLCVNCGYNRLLRCITQLKSKRGPIYRRWLAGRESAAANMKGGNHAQRED
ncbi:hypothetical protein ES708_08935 [subsurface metagenome]